MENSLAKTSEGSLSDVLGGAGMDSLQRNAGLSGILAGVLLAILFLLFLTSGLDIQSLNDPAKALPFIKQSSGRWAFTGFVGLLVSGFSVVFTAGFYRRLRDKAPTRAFAVLLLAVIGATGYAFTSLLQWLGGAQLAGLSDQVAAGHAYAALAAVVQGATGLGNASIGAALVLGGWALVGTQTLNVTAGWVGIVAGIVNALLIFWPASTLLNFGGIALIIIWLVWVGSLLRRR